MADESELWNPAYGYADRGYYRMHSIVGRVTLNIGNNADPVQEHQTTGYLGEVRDGQQRYGEFGFSSMPLPGSHAVVLYQSGHRGWGTAIATEDERYRPTSLNPGESGQYAVDGAGSDGAGGVVWWCLQALLEQIAKLLGKTIVIGDSNTVTITMTGNTINIAGAAGDVVVNGVSLVHHTHANSGGTGPSGEPIQT